MCTSLLSLFMFGSIQCSQTHCAPFKLKGGRQTDDPEHCPNDSEVGPPSNSPHHKRPPSSSKLHQVAPDLLAREAELMRINQQLNQKKESFFRQTEMVFQSSLIFLNVNL
jgi:hypothetical protein